MVKSTRNANSSTPIVALASVDRDSAGAAAEAELLKQNAENSVFDELLAKPLEKSDVTALLLRLGLRLALLEDEAAAASGASHPTSSTPTIHPVPAAAPELSPKTLQGSMRDQQHKQQQASRLQAPPTYRESEA